MTSVLDLALRKNEQLRTQLIATRQMLKNQTIRANRMALAAQVGAAGPAPLPDEAVRIVRAVEKASGLSARQIVSRCRSMAHYAARCALTELLRERGFIEVARSLNLLRGQSRKARANPGEAGAAVLVAAREHLKTNSII